ncbi:DUF4178 domain-containing protein [Pedobacter sp. SYSU D00535]|uniref:DUF4178 domain-containing protein n=1 Tax=Pedobacter sp. SYSU D00535 TaxID=2810308 RepID=UPI001A960B60|nr:DUF4178 domain-containing protein [Pedobacter sp. SYSU D00535]
MATVNLLSFPTPEFADCPKCATSIKLHDPEGSEYCACPNCKSFLRFNRNTATVQKQLQPIAEKPILPLGAEGVLMGFPFKVIAYLEKKEKNTVYRWKEYLLYNYDKGHASLAEFNGHWNFIVGKNWEPDLENVSSTTTEATFRGTDYRIFNKYTPTTLALIGELDWDVLADQPKTYEYIAPPHIISKANGASGKSKAEYFLGEYIKPEVIADAFKIDPVFFPEKDGVGATQPSPHYIKFDTLARLTMLGIVLMLIIHWIITIFKPERELVNSDYNIVFDKGPATTDSSGSITWNMGTYEFKPFVTSSFEQPDHSSALEIEVGSNVDNNWLETTVVLVNETTNETWEVTKGVEYYHGYEGGESWSEGSRQESIILSEIPRGKYHLNVYSASGDPFQTSLHITVRSNITLWRNILLTIFVLVLYPIYNYYRMNSYEKKRWMNSDYSPFDND